MLACVRMRIRLIVYASVFACVHCVFVCVHARVSGRAQCGCVCPRGILFEPSSTYSIFKVKVTVKVRGKDGGGDRK